MNRRRRSSAQDARRALARHIRVARRRAARRVDDLTLTTRHARRALVRRALDVSRALTPTQRRALVGLALAFALGYVARHVLARATHAALGRYDHLGRRLRDGYGDDRFDWSDFDAWTAEDARDYAEYLDRTAADPDLDPDAARRVREAVARWRRDVTVDPDAQAPLATPAQRGAPTRPGFDVDEADALVKRVLADAARHLREERPDVYARVFTEAGELRSLPELQAVLADLESQTAARVRRLRTTENPPATATTAGRVNLDDLTGPGPDDAVIDDAVTDEDENPDPDDYPNEDEFDALLAAMIPNNGDNTADGDDNTADNTGDDDIELSVGIAALSLLPRPAIRITRVDLDPLVGVADHVDRTDVSPGNPNEIFSYELPELPDPAPRVFVTLAALRALGADDALLATFTHYFGDSRVELTDQHVRDYAPAFTVEVLCLLLAEPHREALARVAQLLGESLRQSSLPPAELNQAGGDVRRLLVALFRSMAQARGLREPWGDLLLEHPGTDGDGAVINQPYGDLLGELATPVAELLGAGYRPGPGGGDRG